MSVPLNSYNKNAPIINNTPIKTTKVKKSFIDMHSNKIGYIPVVGTFIGIRRVYKALASEKTNKAEILRGSLEIIACGPILAIIDIMIYSVKTISKCMKKDKTGQKTTPVHSRVSKQPSETIPSKKSIHTPPTPPPIIKKSLPSSILTSPNDTQCILAQPEPIAKNEDIPEEISIEKEKPASELEAPQEEEVSIFPQAKPTTPKETSILDDIQTGLDWFCESFFFF